ncbi:hypothetical protein AX17_000464 [Amanita inopinata Kibby_2008]|nr:hypothetical protein AX17_000464 [Amanita inopinata Kibby_2008]
MEAYQDVNQLWDFAHRSNFSQLPEDDFLAMLQKQYPPEANHPSNNSLPNQATYVDGVNPQNISRYSLSSLTPPSEESSPSPPHSLHDTAGGGPIDESHDPALKRKASDEGLDDGGPNQKSQHTRELPLVDVAVYAHIDGPLLVNNAKKGPSTAVAGTSRRKPSGTGATSAKDESRLLKRKEQNRAAQRAFRERKEKHVKDLEDQVAALEAKNEQATSENENLRDLLTRLQTENVMLKQHQPQPQHPQQHPPQHQGPFTFSMPKNVRGGLEIQNRLSSSFIDSPVFSPTASSSQTSTVLSSPVSSTASPKYTNPFDWSSLTSFDPSVLNVLDETPQATATDGAMSMDFGFGPNSNVLSGFPYTTIASNPTFFTLASTFEGVTPPHQNDMASPMSNHNSFSFDFNPLTPWPTSSNNGQDASLNDIFGYMAPSGSGDYSSFASNTQDAMSAAQRHDTNGSASTSSASSPSDLLRTPVSETNVCLKGEFPKSKSECQKALESSGPSPFAPSVTVNSLSAALKRTIDSNSTPIIACSGSKFPKTVKSDKNVEVLTAWRTITSNPKYKDADLNELCAEFTAKAKCDGTKVVLEPSGVSHILEAFSKK